MTTQLRPALISYSDAEGGAARAALRLHTSLRDIDIESTLHVRKQLLDDSAITQHPPGAVGDLARRLRRFSETRLASLQRGSGSDLRSANILPTRWSTVLNATSANVVNTHWIGAGAMSIKDVSRINAPLVMTLHDMWGFCGAEHYSSTDENARWRVGYSHRKGFWPDFDRWTWARKHNYWQPTLVVAPSNWMADLARDSQLMRGWPVTVVPNPLDTELFRPRSQADARQRLGIEPGIKVVLFGAMGGGSDPRKGFDLLMRSLSLLDSHNDGVVGVVFGEAQPESPPSSPLPLRWLGPIHDDDRLVDAYNAATVMVMPSRQENLGQTGTEAHACGIPVVAFNTGGNADVVEHRSTGYLAEPFSPEDLARGINWALDDGSRHRKLSDAARRRAVSRWNPQVVAQQYVAVYERAIDEAH